MKKSKTEQNFAPVSDFESGLSRLEEVVKNLEAGDLPLEKTVALYREGLYLSNNCKERLEKAQNELTVLTEKGLVPFKDSEFAAAETPDPEED